MDEKLQAYYEARFSMMATQGWKDLCEDAKQMFDAINNVLPIENEQQLHLKRGQLDILQWILNLDASSTQVYEQLMSGDSVDVS
jgi:hypothetical protein